MPYRGKGCPSCQYLHSARRIIAQCTAFSGAVHFDRTRCAAALLVWMHPAIRMISRLF